jgi:hypothetical protein
MLRTARCTFLISSTLVVLFSFGAPRAATPPDTLSSECGKVDVNGRLHAPTAGKDRRVRLLSGAWTAASVSLENTWHLFDQNPGRKACFSSPDGKKVVEIDGEDVTLVIVGHRNAMEFGRLPNSEFGWSPDSKRFFVTWTDGGEEGQWRVWVYKIVDRTFDIVSDHFADNARKDFEQRIRRRPIDPEMNNRQDRPIWESAEYCEPANVAAAKWMNGGSELLVSVMVINVPARCRYGGEFNVYRLRISDGSILERYTARQAHALFGKKYLPIIVR